MRIRNLRNKQGQMRIIETILASFIIVAALAFVGVFAVSPKSPGYEMTDLEKMGYSALHDLDQQGLLAPLVYDQRWSDIRNLLKITMPNDVYFDLTVYSIGGSKLNENSPILFGDSATFSNAKNVASLTYCLAGVPGKGYSPRILVLQLTRG